MADINTDFNWPNCTLTITNDAGQPAPVDGVPVWASSDETVLRVVPSADGMSGLVDTVAPGVGRVTITADADTGGGVTTLTVISEDVNVTQGPSSMATTMNLSFGDPVAKAP